MPQLTIIVPVYNKDAYIDSCIESILRQSYCDFELILIDDGSTDGSGDKCDFYSRLDTRIIVVHQDNLGVSAARNVGLSVATGNYIGFVDCDDTIEIDMYETLLNTVKRYEADVAICGVRKIFSNKIELYFGTHEVKKYNRTQAILALLRRDFSRSVYDKIYKAEIAKKIQFEGSIYEDMFFNFLILNEVENIVFNDVLKYNYTIRESSISMSPFSGKYMDTILFSRRMVEICQQKTPDLIGHAAYFDLVTHISLLNLILMSSKRKEYLVEYTHVANYLEKYSNNLTKERISRKHKYALCIFKFSPVCYAMFMRLYCRITNAHALKRQ